MLIRLTVFTSTFTPRLILTAQPAKHSNQTRCDRGRGPSPLAPTFHKSCPKSKSSGGLIGIKYLPKWLEVAPFHAKIKKLLRNGFWTPCSKGCPLLHHPSRVALQFDLIYTQPATNKSTRLLTGKIINAQSVRHVTRLENLRKFVYVYFVWQFYWT